MRNFLCFCLPPQQKNPNPHEEKFQVKQNEHPMSCFIMFFQMFPSNTHHFPIRKTYKKTTSGWWFEPLWKIWKSIGMITFPNIHGKIKFMATSHHQPVIQIPWVSHENSPGNAREIPHEHPSPVPPWRPSRWGKSPSPPRRLRGCRAPGAWMSDVGWDPRLFWTWGLHHAKSHEYHHHILRFSQIGVAQVIIRNSTSLILTQPWWLGDPPF